MIKQKTIHGPVSIEGIGIQTGAKVKLTLKGAPAGSGVTFVRTDLPDRPSLGIRSIGPGSAEQAERRTTLGFGALQIQTTEHLLAAISGLSIDNLVAELDNVELPGLDGSAGGFMDSIRSGRIVEQEAERRFLEVKDVVWCRDADSLLAALPFDGFKVSYTLSYPGIGAQYVSLVINESDFESQIAPARTFCSEAEALELLKRGLGKGANYENTLVMGASGPINNKLRFPDEPARHKVLDLIGDLSLVGAPLKAHLVAIKSGHKLNMEMVRRLKALL